MGENAYGALDFADECLSGLDEREIIGDSGLMDQDLAASFIGKHLLAGITYLDHNNNLIEQKQLHGYIVRINEHEGIVVRLSDSEDEYKLPPDLDSLKQAPKGEYRLRSTGEVVVDPDLLTNWTVNKSKPED